MSWLKKQKTERQLKFSIAFTSWNAAHTTTPLPESFQPINPRLRKAPGPAVTLLGVDTRKDTQLGQQQNPQNQSCHGWSTIKVRRSPSIQGDHHGEDLGRRWREGGKWGSWSEGEGSKKGDDGVKELLTVAGCGGWAVNLSLQNLHLSPFSFYHLCVKKKTRKFLHNYIFLFFFDKKNWLSLVCNYYHDRF